MDIAKHPGLAKAAKAELDGESRSGSAHLDPNAFPREADVRPSPRPSYHIFTNKPHSGCCVKAVQCDSAVQWSCV